MMACGMAEKGIHLVGAILAAQGIYVLNMRDIASVGIEDPDGKQYHRDGW
jgi:hypothetical protein